MRLSPILLGAAVLAPAALFGCSQQDQGSPRQSIQVSAASFKGQGVVHHAKEDLRDSTDALNITPRVKTAIIGDSQLNDKRNHINVDTKDYVLHLKGHVYSRALKVRAGTIAAHKLKEMHKNYKVSNELSIVK